MSSTAVEQKSMERREVTGVPRAVSILVGLAFLVFFIGWVPLYKWIQATWGQGNELALGLTVAAFWVVVFAIAVIAIRWSGAVTSQWQTRDLLLVAVVGAIFGVLFFAWYAVYGTLGSFLGPWNDLVGGFWWVPSILVPYIVRKPGAALIGETLAAFVSFLAGSPYGFVGTVIPGLVQGAGAEVVFMLFGWRHYNWVTLSLAGVVAAIAGFVYLWPIYYLEYATGLLLITLAAYVIGVLIFAVVGGKLLGDALLATGVLDRFAIGRERRIKEAAPDF